MVGVAGKSSACHNCRKRRVKCSGEKPGCRNCTRVNILCTGYQRERVFIHSHLGAADAQAVTESRTASLKETIAPPVVVAATPLRCIPRARPPQPPELKFPVQVSGRHAYRQQLLAIYMWHYLPAEVIEHGSRVNAKQRNWLLRIPDIPNLAPALESAVMASCAAKLGRLEKHRALAHESLAQYNKSILELQRDLRHPALRYQDQTLAACMALTMYEFTECPTGQVQGYLAHYTGAIELLQRRGPGAHSSGLGHSVFRALRLHSVFRSLQQRSVSFLAEPEWLEQPWAFQHRDPHDQLVDILLKAPSVYTAVDVVWNEPSPNKVIAGLLRAVQECWRLDSSLRQWMHRFEASVAGALYWPELAKTVSPVDSPELGKLIPVAYRFPSFIIAQTLVIYWTASVLFHQHMCQLYQRLDTLVNQVDRTIISCVCDESDTQEGTDAVSTCPKHFTPDRLPPLEHRREWATTGARDVCQSVEYFLQDNMRCLGPASILPCLMILGWLWERKPGNWNREALWVKYMLGTVRDKGNGIAACTEEQVGQWNLRGPS